MSSNRQTPSGITWRDVQAHMDEMAEEHLGHTVIELRHVPSAFGAPARLELVAANYIGNHRTARNTRAAVQQRWPTHKYKTFTGACVGLLYELASELEAEQAKKRLAPKGGEQGELFRS